MKGENRGAGVEKDVSVEKGDTDNAKPVCLLMFGSRDAVPTDGFRFSILHSCSYRFSEMLGLL